MFLGDQSVYVFGNLRLLKLVSIFLWVGDLCVIRRNFGSLRDWQGAHSGDINTGDCHNLAMRLRRNCQARGFAAKCPNVSAMFEGANEERLRLLHEFLQNGESLRAVEAELEIQKVNEEEHMGQDMLLTVKQMREKGVSEYLGAVLNVFVLCFMRGFRWNSNNIFIQHCAGKGLRFGL